MKIARTAVLSLALIALNAGLSLGADLSQVVRTIEQGYGSLNDLQADFSQRSSIRALKREEKGGGELLLKKGGGKESMFRFNYTKPKQQIVSNGKTVWYYIPDQKQVMVMDLAQLLEASNGIAMNYLSGLGQVSKDFSIAFAAEQKDKNGNYQLELTPHKKSPAMAKLLLTISGEAVESMVAKGKSSTPFPVLSSTVVDQTGNTTRMDFSGVKTNRGISSGKFSFKIPSGVQVIKR
ncbi:LolA family protein [Geomonas subterranea]|uniref:Outer membrane lipoprotein carrier protein LolA n=1 Tax=Geomonas subterranea TaxID=2847989 RepID=A0ABX8LBJ9_9BACT|nr:MULTISPECIES: outer membrane lipoprotein carrier protein LolA [Geomonas]QXE89392.1 outer membrane lipoprotein carrier protein LolA [Geomonas subterranea]QXM08492.1 outer membrane lipoprotein carrier protein LolA [Geomonas subterranea]